MRNSLLLDILAGKLQQFTWNKNQSTGDFRDISVACNKPWRQTYRYNLAVQTLPPAATRTALRGRKGSKVKETERSRTWANRSYSVQKTNLLPKSGFFWEVARNSNVHRQSALNTASWRLAESCQVLLVQFQRSITLWIVMPNCHLTVFLMNTRTWAKTTTSARVCMASK